MIVLVTQRVAVVADVGERRDELDQRWAPLLLAADLVPVAVPNHPATAEALLDALPVGGVLLTGGNDLGSAPERDATERLLLDRAAERRLPVLGVCRGMQVIQHWLGVPLVPVEGHVTRAQEIVLDGRPRTVNSYHRWGATTTVADLEVRGIAPDGVIKAVRHRTLPIHGVMWHPERNDPFEETDLTLLRGLFDPR